MTPEPKIKKNDVSPEDYQEVCQFILLSAIGSFSTDDVGDSEKLIVDVNYRDQTCKISLPEAEFIVSSTINQN